MKIVQMTLLAAAVLGAATASSFAESNDAPTARQQAETLWIATGDATLAKAAGFSDTQIRGARNLPFEQVELGANYSN